jgi:hypothetical protein
MDSVMNFMDRVFVNTLRPESRSEGQQRQRNQRLGEFGISAASRQRGCGHQRREVSRVTAITGAREEGLRARAFSFHRGSLPLHQPAIAQTYCAPGLLGKPAPWRFLFSLCTALLFLCTALLSLRTALLSPSPACLSAPPAREKKRAAHKMALGTATSANLQLIVLCGDSGSAYV